MPKHRPIIPETKPPLRVNEQGYAKPRPILPKMQKNLKKPSKGRNR